MCIVCHGSVIINISLSNLTFKIVVNVNDRRMLSHPCQWEMVRFKIFHEWVKAFSGQKLFGGRLMPVSHWKASLRKQKSLTLEDSSLFQTLVERLCEYDCTSRYFSHILFSKILNVLHFYTCLDQNGCFILSDFLTWLSIAY